MVIEEGLETDFFIVLVLNKEKVKGEWEESENEKVEESNTMITGNTNENIYIF